MNKEYKGFKLQNVVHRHNALKILQAPSRMFNSLYYPDKIKKPLADPKDKK